MTAHSKVGASGMHRWANCPGSVRLCEHSPRKSSFAAAEGTVAHSVGEAVLRGEGWQPAGAVRQCDGHDIPITQEMLDAVQVYVDAVNEQRMPGDTVLVEQPFHLKTLHEGLFGTSDCVVWSPSMKLLDVFDYKHGAGLAVEVKNNPQLKYYALGALLESKFPARRVRMTIVQPRCPHPDGPVRAVEFDAIDLLDFSADLVEAVKRTEEPRAPLHAGEWCRFCPALAWCPAQREEAQSLAKVAFDAPVAVQPPAAATIAPADLSRILDRAPIFEAWLKAVREYAYQQAEDGNPPPSYKLVEKMAHRKVRDDVAPKVIAKAAGCKEAELYVKKLLGVTELEKLMPGKNAKERAAALAPFVVRESTGHVLVHESDGRAAVVRDPQAAAKLAFNPEQIS